MQMNHHEANPLAEILTDDTYQMLAEQNLLNEKGVRNYQMRKQFRELRERDIPATEAIERIREEHAYLQYDTVRKIVYRVTG